MMTDKQFIGNILSDLKVELADEFDKNFEQKGFFGTPWAPTVKTISRGSLMIRTGDLRKSIRPTITEGTISFTSSLPYASIQNEGGQITVTAKMKTFFWAMYYKASGAVTTKKDGSASKSKKNVALTAEATYWKNMALMKVGEKLTIPQRQFLGHHPQIDTIIVKIVDDNIKEYVESITEQLRRYGHH